MQPSDPQYPQFNQQTTGQYPPNFPVGQYSQTPPPPGYSQNPSSFPLNGQNYPPMPAGYPPMQQPPTKKKSRKGLIVASILIGALVLCGVIATSHSNSNTGTEVKNTISSNTTGSNTNSQPASQSGQHFKAGDSVKVGGLWKIIVNSVKADPGGEYSVLKQGDVYLLIDVSMTNISQQEQTTSSLLDWSLKDTNGQKYNTTFFSGASAAPDGKVEAGSPAKGVLAYEVPSSVKSFQLAFESNVFESGQTIWDLTVP